MHDPLAPLLADGVIDEVCARLKSGKEADLWLVRHGGEIVAAKVYKARHVRSFRNDAVYREGRQVRDTRTQRAMDRGSRFGQAAAEEAWKTKESDALHTLYAAGVRVPRPVMFYEGVLLMEVVVDAHGHPAPRLVDAPFPREQAAALYADLRAQAVRMLCCDLVHGDLSPYNVLLGHAGPVVIDFPQVIGAAHNAQAERFFRRDVENLQRFFAAVDPALRAAAGDAAEIWRAYVRRELTPDFVPSGRHVEPHRGEGRRRDEGGRPSHGQGGGPRHPGQRREERRPHPADGGGRPPREGRGAPAPQGGSHRAAPQAGSGVTAPQGGSHRTAAQGGSGGPAPQGGPRRPAPQGGPGGRPPDRRGGDRRHPAGRPAPEVVRVVRPPLGGGSPGAAGRAQPHPARPAKPQHAQQAPPQKPQPAQHAQRQPSAPQPPRPAHAPGGPGHAPGAAPGSRRDHGGRRRRWR